MAYQRRPYPQWSWSYSRASLFAECQRKYYYHYYAAHNGWERSAPLAAQRAYRLKQLTNLYRVFGEAMHRAASHAVKTLYDVPVPPERLLQHVREKLNGAYLSSRRRARWMQAPNKYPMLHELYYGEELPSSTVERLKTRLSLCLSHLQQSHTLNELSGLSAGHIIENDAAEPFDYQGTTVYAIPDLVYAPHTGQRVIVDWKTGDDAESHRVQLALYGLYAHLRYGPVQETLVRVEYLEQGRYQEARLDAGDLEAAGRFIAHSACEMQALLLDSGENRPQDAVSFPQTTTRERCRWCNFYELCLEEWCGEEVPGRCS